jgi:predicted O-methyltransferase YrrM
MRRYTQITSLLERLMPHSVLEVGTWNGARAVEMLHFSDVYYGFDLFEEATEETDKEEFNVKPHYSIADVARRLQSVRYPTRKEFYLYKGNTRDTLPRFALDTPNKIDFVWLDGGHSVETIRSDWENIRKVLSDWAIVLFDDYYTGMPEEKLDKVGCNRVVENLKHEVLPIADPVSGGGFVQIVRVYQEPVCP